MANQFPVLMAIQLLRYSRDLIENLRCRSTFLSTNFTNSTNSHSHDLSEFTQTNQPSPAVKTDSGYDLDVDTKIQRILMAY